MSQCLKLVEKGRSSLRKICWHPLVQMVQTKPSDKFSNKDFQSPGPFNQGTSIGFINISSASVIARVLNLLKQQHTIYENCYEGRLPSFLKGLILLQFPNALFLTVHLFAISLVLLQHPVCLLKSGVSVEIRDLYLLEQLLFTASLGTTSTLIYGQLQL